MYTECRNKLWDFLCLPIFCFKYVLAKCNNTVWDSFHNDPCKWIATYITAYLRVQVIWWEVTVIRASLRSLIRSSVGGRRNLGWERTRVGIGKWEVMISEWYGSCSDTTSHLIFYFKKKMMIDFSNNYA